MASYTVTFSKHATLTAATVDTVTLGSDFNSVEVKNRGPSGDITFTVNGVTPVALADNTDVVGSGEALQVEIPTDGPAVVKLISAGTPAYSVRGIW